MKYTLHQNRWHGEEPAIIDVPDTWNVHYAAMKGDDLPALSVEDMRRTIRAPIGSAPLRELAAQRKNAIILFENMSRGADIKTTAHLVLEELLAGGMSKENILFMCANATHGPLERDDFVKKLGEDIVADYLVYNHNCWYGFANLGKTSRGYEVKINQTVMEYELKIGLGGLVPHPSAGFGGGSKILLPGVTSIDTIVENHRLLQGKLIDRNACMMTNMLGNLQNVDVREDFEEVAQMAGLDFVVDTLYNTKTETVGLVAGHPLPAYYKGVEMAREVYATERFDKVDVCIANGNAKANEAGLSKMVAEECLKPGGDVVLINFTEVGDVNHYLSGTWGPGHSGPLGNGKPMGTYPTTRKVIIYSPYKSKTVLRNYGDRAVWASTWEEVMEQLSDRGPGTTCAIWPDATIQMFADDFKFDYEPTNLNRFLSQQHEEKEGK